MARKGHRSKTENQKIAEQILDGYDSLSYETQIVFCKFLDTLLAEINLLIKKNIKSEVIAND